MQQLIRTIRSETSNESYFPDWPSRNLRCAQEHWTGVLPYSILLWPRYFSDIIRHGDAWYRYENSADLSIELLLEGEITYRQQERETVLHPGQLYFIHEGNDCLLTNAPDKFYHKLRLILIGNMVRALTEGLRLHEVHAITLREPEKFVRRFREIGRLLATHAPENAGELSALSYALLADLAHEHQCDTLQTLPEQLYRAVIAMKADLGERSSIPEIAGSVGIGVHTLMRLFRRHLQSSPQEYRIRLRQEEARRLVGGSELSFKEIATRLGYRNSLYFSTAFKRFHGTGPTAYRAAVRAAKQSV